MAENTVPRLKTQYQNEVIPALMKQFNYKNIMQAPRIEKVVINMGVGQAGQTGGDSKLLDNAIRDLTAISGQKPAVCRAKKSVANFKLRAGARIGAKVTLRGARMYEFLDRLFNVTLPRVRDFQGINPNSFDGRGNFAMGMKEQLTFPEIEYDKIDKIRGMDIIIVTTATNDTESRFLLQQMGLPFRATGNTGPGGATRLQM
jgi:large subunit ribosomal protein L5